MKNQLQEFMRRFLLLIVCIHFLMVPAFAQFAGGDGSAEDPWQIATLEQLQLVGESGHLEKHFILVNDIDAGETSGWDDGKGFKPIGASGASFNGTFNGDGHVISNLYISRDEEYNVGLFGYATEAVIKNVGLEKIDIKGRRWVGGLVGWSDLIQVYYSYAEGRVEGTSSGVGGLIGAHAHSGCYKDEFIYASYAHVDVTGEAWVGGLIGLITVVDFIASESEYEDVSNFRKSPNMMSEYRKIAKCRVSHVFATGQVTGNNDVGGLVGFQDDIDESFISSGYWDIENSGQEKGIGNRDFGGTKGLTTDQMNGQDAYIHMYRLDFDQVWKLTESYPVLHWQNPDEAVDQPQVPIVTLEPSREQIDFGEVETDNSETRSFTINNTGNEVMSGMVSLSEAHDGVFEIIRGDGEYTLDPDNSIVVEVAFHPAGEDTFQTGLEIHHDAPNRDDPLVMELKGSGKTPTSVDEEKSLPRHPQLHQNYPNPFNPYTKIGFEIPEQTHVQITVYNAIGQKVATLVNEVRPAGRHEVVWDASRMSSGVYLIRMVVAPDGGQQHMFNRSVTLVK
jgi:hypothetical protein